MKLKKLALLSIISVALISGCTDKEKIDESAIAKQNQENVATKKEVQKQIPTFNLKRDTGEIITIVADMNKGWSFKGYENKVVLLDFFGTWCPPCKAEIPHLNNIREKLKKDFEIIGIDIGQRGGGLTPANEMAQFIKDYKIKYPITMGADNGKLFGAVSELNPNGSIPFMVLFNKKGEFVQHYIGMKPEEMLMRDIQTTIKMK
ncbi:MAG: TlpA disulfide reductase family protein [Campylobacterota bacterium]|nr:TlpA disulfide reductase family protein [Campylobacterota bacterium]